MEIAEITLYNIAREKFGDEKAKDFVSAIKKTVDEKYEANEKVLASKQDIYLLKSDLDKTKTEILKFLFGAWATLMGAIIASLFLK